jgi:predicted molibdopterin-dependent oxidoreductase YjgC
MGEDGQNVIIINGNPYAFEPGETILEVARRHDIDIPTLCHLKGAPPTGACRVCVVEVEGAASLMASCATPAGSGMAVHTETPKVVAARRQVLDLMLASGNHNCTIRQPDEADWTAQQLKVMQEDQAEELCPVWGDCRLQELAFRYQVTAKRYDPAKTLYPQELANPFIVRDFSRCIRCGRCIQACNEVQVNNAINFGFRGAALKIVAAGDRPLRNSDCVFCGECVQACPVGALVEKDTRYRVRPWETTRTRTTCSYCGVGCQLDLHVADGRVVRVTGAEDVAPNYGSLCVKGRFGYDFIHSPERLTTPLVRDGNHLREATWDEALDRVATGFKAIRERDGADAIGVLCSARITNEENYLLNKLARAALGTNNIDHCARL